MKSIETDFIHVSILDEKTVLVEAVDGVDIDDKKSQYGCALIDKEMSGDYGMIIDRKTDHSIVPIDVYRNLNGLQKLKAIAIVLHKKRNFLPIEMEQKLFKENWKYLETSTRRRNGLQKPSNIVFADRGQKYFLPTLMQSRCTDGCLTKYK